MEEHSDNISFMDLEREQPNFIFNENLLYNIRRKYARIKLTPEQRNKLIIQEYNKQKKPVMSKKELKKEFYKRIDERNKRKAINPNKNLKERVKEEAEKIIMGDRLRNKKSYAILMTVIVLALGGSYLKYLSEESRKKKKKK
tara:strand:+ start:292 stop:717 length:426 start_codon:yes stop_codon:yes gene_type:complete